MRRFSDLVLKTLANQQGGSVATAFEGVLAGNTEITREQFKEVLGRIDKGACWGRLGWWTWVNMCGLKQGHGSSWCWAAPTRVGGGLGAMAVRVNEEAGGERW